MSTTLRRSLVIVLAALAVLMPSMASAADEMGLSRDGVTYAPTLEGTLFDDGMTWVPGDTETATFFVRNQGKAAAQLTIDLLGASMTALLDSGDLTVTASAGGQTGTLASAAEQRLLTVQGIVDQQVVPVTITIAFDPASTNDTQLLASDVGFRVNLQQTGPLDGGSGSNDGGVGQVPDSGSGDGTSGGTGDNSSGGAGNDSDTGGLLPNTGAEISIWAVLLAALAIGAGTAIVHSRHTHDQGATHG